MSNLIQANAVQIPLKDKSVQLCCFSPPYWGLRKYSVLPLVWGGDEDCQHKWGDKILGPTTAQYDNDGRQKIDAKDWSKGVASRKWTKPQHGQLCLHCNAWRGDLGLEPTPELYLDHMMQVMAECWRVLRDDGVCFVNIGDSYAGSGSPGGDFRNGKGGDEYLRPYNRKGGRLKPKSLCLIPDEFRIRCRNAGWIIRSKIVWHKTNPMPESATDRPTSSYEDVIMMTKSNKPLFWTHPRKRGTRRQPAADYIWKHKHANLIVGYFPVSNRLIHKYWARQNLWRGHDYFWDQDAVREPHLPQSIQREEYGYNAAFKGRHTMPGEKRPHSTDHKGFLSANGRNIRDVWTIATEPTPEAHFATWPTKLVERMIRAATSHKACPVCGAAWKRTEEKQYPEMRNVKSRTAPGQTSQGLLSTKRFDEPIITKTIGWQPTCSCPDNDGSGRCVVFDPFCGTGKTVIEAERLGRVGIGMDLSWEYLSDIAKKRCAMPLQKVMF